MSSRTLVVITAGAPQPHFSPLSATHDRAATSFAGAYRIIDFALSNCLNSGLRRILVLTPSHARDLRDHLGANWGQLNTSASEFLLTLSPEEIAGAVESAEQGDGAALCHSLSYIASVAPDLVLVLAANQIYALDYGALVDFHLSKGAGATVAAFPVAADEVQRYHILEVNAQARVISLEERPASFMPLDASIPPLACMGVYLFTHDVLRGILLEASADAGGSRSLAGDFLPALVWNEQFYAYRVPRAERPFFWREISTVDDYWAASMELLTNPAAFDPTDPAWPMRAAARQASMPPALVRHFRPTSAAPAGVEQSIVADDCRGSGAQVLKSVLSPGVRLGANSSLVESVLLEETAVGENCRLSRVILDRGVAIPADTEIGLNPEEDRRWFHVTPNGIVVVTAESIERYERGRLRPTKVAARDGTNHNPSDAHAVP
ncbi:MAG: hypothetical protein HYY96_03515 [Candidatus Tectomicrobia bacterium]|nr:hypothetical protein [Candidatus Tectomicrobia bacterium]